MRLSSQSHNLTLSLSHSLRAFSNVKAVKAARLANFNPGIYGSICKL